MKRIVATSVLALAAVFGQAQEITDVGQGSLVSPAATPVNYQQSPAQSGDYTTETRGSPQVVFDQTSDGGVRLVNQTSRVEWVMPSFGSMNTHRRLGRSGEFAWNYYARQRQFHWDSLAGCLVDCLPDGTPVRKVGCGNVLLVPRPTKVVTNTVTQERTLTHEVRVEVPVIQDHFHTEYVDRPQPYAVEVPVYHRVTVWMPGMQAVATIGAPNVSIGGGGGGGFSIAGGTSISSTNTNANTAYGGQGGKGGNGGKASALASASASASASAAAAAAAGHH